ncbi:hypothetical protein ACFSHP_24865 [Novosphingobium panipatense]
MNERHAPPGARKRFRKSAWIAAGLLVMFLAAMAITSTTIGIVDRPGHDPGSVQKAPATRPICRATALRKEARPHRDRTTERGSVPAMGVPALNECSIVTSCPPHDHRRS